MLQTRTTKWTAPGAELLGVEELGKVLLWLAAGALLGVAVAVPYDRLLGLPSATGALLRSAVWVILLELPRIHPMGHDACNNAHLVLY